MGRDRPLNTTTGYYAVATALGLYFNQSQCELGRYCIAGVAAPCAAGRYGVEMGMINASCTDVCDRGYFCAAGSWSPTQRECGAAGYYCPTVRRGLLAAVL
jgi:hypothetical protein